MPNKERDIKKLKIQTDEVIESTMFFEQMLIDFIPAPIFYKDTKGVYLGGNKAFVQYIGLSPEQFIGKTVYDISPEDLAEKYDKADKELLNNPGVQTYEASVVYADGTRHDVVFNKATFTDAEGKVAGLMGVILDITKRKRAEEALQRAHAELEQRVADRTKELTQVNEDLRTEVAARERAEETLQRTNLELLSIIDNFPFLAWLKDSEGRFMAVNEPFVHSCNFTSADDLIGKTDFDIWPQRLAEAYRADDLEVMHTRQKKSVEELISDQGVQRWFETYKAPLYDVDGNIIGTTGFSRDITVRMHAEEESRNAEARYRILFEQSPNGILLMDTETGKTIEANETAYKQLGYTREEFAAQSIADYEVVEKHEETANHIQTVLRDGSDDFETLQRTKSGEIRNVHVWAKTVELSNHRFFYAIFQDITDRKKAERQLHETLDSLRKSISTTIQVMVSTVEARDPYTAGHQLKSANLARAIATEMGLSHDKIEGIRMAGSIHDIGKISIPAEILSKPTKLSEIEFSLIKAHAQRGFEMLKDVESPWPLAEIVRQHHERMDGSGYPRNLKGEEILIEARILAVADTVEAMASHRPYRPGLGIEAALAEIEKNRGIFYDKTVADACLRLFREKGFKLEST